MSTVCLNKRVQRGVGTGHFLSLIRTIFIILFALHQLWKSQKRRKILQQSVHVHKIIPWSINLCCRSSTVLTHSNDCYARFSVCSVNSGNVRAVGMSLTPGEPQHWLAVATCNVTWKVQCFQPRVSRPWTPHRRICIACIARFVSSKVRSHLIASLHWLCL